ncbi:uncharacterized protein LOC135714032 [Ochlerotatus camptorhynchus]|uniref:uncharacterized protein LOC135714032 n=1 Tax=Ochlerotatus camptorhynchus TaxID=644619 RepID=UPI0031E369ED
MGICTYFLNNTCRFGSKCNNDHIDLSSVIKSEVDVTLKGNQWPLSCFGPFKERNCVPNFIDDVSFEEIRMMYLEAKMQNNIPGHQMQLMQMINEAKQKMQWLTTTNRDIMNMLIEIYNQQDDSSKSSAPAGGNPFAAPIGASATSAASIFGGATSNSSSGFGTGSTAFGGSSTTAGNIFGAPPNQSAANIFGSGPTSTSMGGNIFGKPAQTTTGAPNIFGTPALGQPQQQTNSVFGGPPVFGASGPSLFSSTSQNPQTVGGSIFGNANANTSAGNLFTQSSVFGQPAPNPNIFATSAQSQPTVSPFAAAPAPANNLFSSAPTFATPTAAQPQQQQNLFTSAFSAQQSGSPFGQPGQQQQQSSQSLFLPPPQTAAQPPSMTSTHPSTFGTTPGVFGGNTQQSAIPLTNQSTTIYSRMENLAKEHLDAFSAERFELGKIPTVPPPREMCV